MKTLTKIIPGSWPAILALILMSSCYEFVYVTQEDDIHQYNSLQTKISVHVINNLDKPFMPYFGILLPTDWKVMNNFDYIQIVNGISIKKGTIEWSHQLTMNMQSIDPAPPNYFWWVGKGTSGITKSGIYNVYPQIQTGSKLGSFEIEYMIGDSYNGLNQLRSETKSVEVINRFTPHDLILASESNSIVLNWKPPIHVADLMGYDVYRDNHKINTTLVLQNNYTDLNIDAGPYSYYVFPVYQLNHSGVASIPQGICYARKGPSVIFDGQDDKIVIYDHSTLNVHQQITLEAWIKPEFNFTSEACILSKGFQGKGYELKTIKQGHSDILVFILPVGKLKSNQILEPGKWYHVAAIYDGMKMKLYINGKPDAEMQASGFLSNTNAPLVIGRSSQANYDYFYGNIDDIRIWQVARTENQIRSNFTKILSGKEIGLAGNWQMQEGCRFTACDISSNGNDGYLAGSCWCAKDFPYVEDTYTNNSSALIVPVKNYDPVNQKPLKIELEFKINPQLLEFQGLILENTQLASCNKVMIFCNPNGTIKITALNNEQNLLNGDVLLYVKLRPLLDNVFTTLDFYTFKSDGENLRTFSGLVVASDIGHKSIGDENNSNFEPGDFSINIYPNPVSNFLNVKMTNANQPVDLQVINILGQVIYEEKIVEPDAGLIHLIDVTQYETGVYLLNVTNAGKRSVKKFFVN